MNYDLYKMLSDRNPDGNVSYSMEDMEIITEEDNKQQGAFRNLIMPDYTVLLEEVRKRISGIATFAFNKETSATRISFQYNRNEPSYAIVLVELWGEKLNDVQLFAKDEKIGNWTVSESTSHRFNFLLPVATDVSRQANQIEFGIPLI